MTNKRQVESGFRTLILMRHAEAVDSHPKGDKYRTLTPQGTLQARTAGQLIEKMRLVPSFVIQSDAVRIIETMKNMAHSWPNPLPVCRSEPRLYNIPYDFTNLHLLNFFEQIVDQADDEAGSLLVLGHNPSIAQLVDILNKGFPSQLENNFPTATCAIFKTTAASWLLVEPDNCKLETLIVGRTVCYQV